LKELSTFFTENTLNSRRNLRSKIERRSLTINEEFLAAFKQVKGSLDDVYQDVLAMNTAVQSMTNRLQATKAQTSQLLEQTTKLQNERFRSYIDTNNEAIQKNLLLVRVIHLKSEIYCSALFPVKRYPCNKK